MATQTVTLDQDAYERLLAAQAGDESLSEVVRRASFARPAPTGAELLAYFRVGGSGVSDEYLASVEEAARRDAPPDDPWA